MNKIILILAVFVCFGCNTIKETQKRSKQRKIQRILSKYPALLDSDTTYQIIYDTLIVETPIYEHDTIVSFNDTLIVETEKFKTVIVRDTLNSNTIEVKTLIKSDTIKVFTIDTITRIKERITTKTDVQKHIPIWLIILCIVLGILFVISEHRKLKSLFDNLEA
jgi:hypothetical protein